MGSRVRLHYGPRWRAAVQPGLHGAEGTVIARARGPGPRNVMVELADGRQVVVPRGNVRRVGGDSGAGVAAGDPR